MKIRSAGPSGGAETEALDVGAVAPVALVAPRKRISETASVIAAYLVCATIWGTTWYAIRVCIAPGAYPIFPAAAIRFTACSLILGVVWFFYRKRIEAPSRAVAKWILVAGLLAGLSYGLLYQGEQSVSGGVAAVIAALGPLVAAFIAMATRTEKPSLMTIIGSTVALAGIAFVFHDSMRVSMQEASAIGLLLFNCILTQSSNVVMKRQGQTVAAIPSNTIYFTGAAIVLWALAILRGQMNFPAHLPQAATVSLLYLTIFGTLVTFAAWFYVLKRVRLSTAVTLAFVTPVIALIVDAFFEKQIVLGVGSYVGAGIILAGVALTVMFKSPTRASSLSENSKSR